jgi:hypothetical protein
MVFFVFLLLILQNAYSMEEQQPKINFGKLYNKNRAEAFNNLSPEQQSVLTPARYKDNTDQGHEALQHMANFIVRKANLSPEVADEFREYIIMLRDGSVGLTEIIVTDKMTAAAKANRFLDTTLKETMQPVQYVKNREAALLGFEVLGGKIYEECEQHNIPTKRSKEEYVKKFVNKKQMELDNIKQKLLEITEQERARFLSYREQYIPDALKALDKKHPEQRKAIKEYTNKEQGRNALRILAKIALAEIDTKEFPLEREKFTQFMITAREQFLESLPFKIIDEFSAECCALSCFKEKNHYLQKEYYCAFPNEVQNLLEIWGKKTFELLEQHDLHGSISKEDYVKNFIERKNNWYDTIHNNEKVKEEN